MNKINNSLMDPLMYNMNKEYLKLNANLNVHNVTFNVIVIIIIIMGFYFLITHLKYKPNNAKKVNFIDHLYKNYLIK